MPQKSSSSSRRRRKQGKYIQAGLLPPAMPHLAVEREKGADIRHKLVKNEQRTVRNGSCYKVSYIHHTAPPLQEPDRTSRLCTPLLHPLPLHRHLYAAGWLTGNKIRHKTTLKPALDSNILMGESFTIIFVKQSSTELPVSHSISALSSLMLLTDHVSHLSVSALPTAHHLMAVDVVLKAGSEKAKKKDRHWPQSFGRTHVFAWWFGC